MYLLDTDTLSDLGKPRPSPRLLDRLASEVHPLYTSSITVAEMVYGAYKTDAPERYLERMDSAFIALSGILPFDQTAAQHFGRLLAHLEQRGTPIEPLDLQIASIARANDLILVTHNIRHFERIVSLKLEDWL